MHKNFYMHALHCTVYIDPLKKANDVLQPIFFEKIQCENKEFSFIIIAQSKENQYLLASCLGIFGFEW